MLKRYIVLVCALLFFTAGAVCAEEIDTEKEKSWYLGGGLGFSWLEPDASGTSYSVQDTNSNGFKLYVGYDLKDRWSLEGYYAVMGEAGLAPRGTVDYLDYGINGIYYFYQSKPYQEQTSREKLAAFVRLGIGWMENESDVPYEQVNSSHILIGLGMEYGLCSGVSLRAEIDLYDEDSQLATLSLLKRFGMKRR